VTNTTEAYENDFEIFYNSFETKPKLSENLDLIDLYERFFKRKYDDFLSEKNELVSSKPGIKTICESYEKFIKRHQYMALYTLFKEETLLSLLSEKLLQNHNKKYELYQDKISVPLENLFKNMKNKISSDINDIKEGKLNMGIIDEIIGDKPHFIHKTFAEYLVAKFLVTTLENETAVVSELYRILIDPDHQSIGKFFNGLLGKTNLPHNVIKISGECIEKLWQENPNNLCNKNDDTLLQVAAAEGNLFTMKFLFESLKGRDIVLDFLINGNSKGLMKDKIMYEAARIVHLKVVKYLVDNGFDFQSVNELKLMLESAIESGNLELVQYLIDKNKDFDIIKIIPERVLQRAAVLNKWEIFKYLVDKGADVNAINIYGKSVLHMAVESGNLEIFKDLVDKGADVNAKDKNGETVLHKAAESGHFGIFKCLVDNGTYINEINENGETVLHKAAACGNFGMFKYLANKGAFTNAKDKNGKTVLHTAAESGNLEIFKDLVDKGADVKSKDVNDQTMLHVADRSGNLQLEQYLIEKNFVVQ